MTARTFEVNDLAPGERRGTGVRVSPDRQLRYDLTVIAADADTVVAAAGGWLCDRVRAGWRVTVQVPPGTDVRGLTILGLHCAERDSDGDWLTRATPAAIAIDAAVLRRDEQLRAELLRVVDAAVVEVTVWGDSGLFAADRRFRRVSHRLSAAARAFKSAALLSAGVTAAPEEFVSAALWYPQDSTDLVAVPAGR